MSQHHVAELWYAVYCQPLKERLVGAWLSSQLDLKVYLPEVKSLNGGRVEYKPFFPRYLFVEADLERVATSQINATPGVLYLVAFGGGPQPLAPSVVEVLRQRLDQMNQGVEAISSDPRPGSMVRLKSGPLQGLEAVFIKTMSPGERVKVLVEFLGRPHVLEVPASALGLDRASGARRPRRSRGKGRPIRGAV